jgi:hypothetical protein
MAECEPTACTMKETIEQTQVMTQKIHDKLLGTFDSKGMIGDVEDLKSWRSTQTNRYKSRNAWLYGVLGAGAVKIFDYLPKIITKIFG